MPSLLCPIFKSKKTKKTTTRKKKSSRNVNDKYVKQGLIGSVDSGVVLSDYSPGSNTSPRGRDASSKTSGGTGSPSKASSGHTPLSLRNVHGSYRDDDSSLPTVDPDYNPTTDDYSLSDAGGTIGSQSRLSTSLFTSPDRATFGSNGAKYEQGLYNETTYYQPQHTYITQQYSQPRQITLEIHAPPGKLGVVIDVPSNSTTPVVHAIKDTCPIRNEILVGDQLLAVDGEDVRNMTAVEVSRLISRKSHQGVRKLTIRRSERSNTGFGGVSDDDGVYDLTRFGMK